jgi:hypothetical protein
MTLFRFAEACTACGQPCHTNCDGCSKPFCDHGACLFLTGEVLTFPSDPRDEYYADEPTWSRNEELCLECYMTRKGHPPFILWEETAMQSVLAILGTGVLEPGTSIPAGDSHSWYSPPRAGTLMTLKRGDQEIPFDVFRLVQLLNMLKANEESLRAAAKATSDILVPISRRDTQRAIDADSGHIDYSQYE